MEANLLNSPDGLPPPTAKFGIGDIYYTLFRHKKKIALCAVLGLVAGAGYYTTREPLYQSDAKLFIRYVVSESGAMPGEAHDTKVLRGGAIMASETQIIESMDLSMKVAEAFGPEKLLKAAGGGNDKLEAAMVVRQGIKVWNPWNTTTLIIAFQHADPEVVQPVLELVVRQYLRMHLLVHSARGEVGNLLAQETDQLRSRLAITEAELRRAKKSAGVVDSVESSIKNLAAEIAATRAELFRTQVELTQRTTILNIVAEHGKEQAQKSGETQANEPPAIEVPADTIDALRKASNRMAILERMEQELLTRYTPENSQVKDVRTQLTEASSTRDAILKQYPHLAQTSDAAVTAAGAPPPNMTQRLDPVMAAGEVKALETKLTLLQEQLTQLETQLSRVHEMEGTIVELQRRKDMQEVNYRNYVASLEQSRIAATLGNESLPNISEIQSPSPSYYNDGGFAKNAAIIAAAGLGFGLAWAFALELFLDQRVRRPTEVEAKLGIPFFLSLPRITARRIRKDRKSQQKEQAQAIKDAEAAGTALQVAEPGAQLPALTPFYETLRDRLLQYFESRNLTHKPKLIAVTSLNKGAGVSSMAAGLSQSLSLSHEGNVLLVNLSGDQGSTHHFVKGREVCDLENLLDSQEPEQVSSNLYMVSERGNSAELSRNLPNRFNRLVPWLKTSDFDYIIFDMPVVNQISITPRLAGFMDMVLLVLESEKTDREMARRAAKLLGHSKANVAAVLNKTHNYVPSKVHQEFSLTY